MKKIYMMLLSLIIMSSIYAQPNVVLFSEYDDASNWTLELSNGADATLSSVTEDGRDVLKLEVLTKGSAASDIKLITTTPAKLDPKYNTTTGSLRTHIAFLGKSSVNATVKKFNIGTITTTGESMGANKQFTTSWVEYQKAGGKMTFNRGLELNAVFNVGLTEELVYYLDSVTVRIEDLEDATPILSSVTIDTVQATQIYATSSQNATLYLVPDGTNATAADIKAAAIKTTNATAAVEDSLSTNFVEPGTYKVYAIDDYDIISAASPDINITTSGDGDAPTLGAIPSQLITGESFDATVNEWATLYMVGDNIGVTPADIASKAVLTAEVETGTTAISTLGVAIGHYDLYALDGSNNLSDKVDIELTPDNKDPELSEVTLGSFTMSSTVFVSAKSNEDGKLYLVTNGTLNNIQDIRKNCADSVDVTAGNAGNISTEWVYDGEYVFYAVDGAGNVSAPSGIITTQRPPAQEHATTYNADWFPTNSISLASKDTTINGIAYTYKTIKWQGGTYFRISGTDGQIQFITKFGVGSILNPVLNRNLLVYVNGDSIGSIEPYEIYDANINVQNNDPDTVVLIPSGYSYNIEMNEFAWSEFGAQITDSFPPKLSGTDTDIYQGTNFATTCSEDAIVYIVPLGTASDKTAIESAKVDSLHVKKLIRTAKNSGNTTAGDYIMYAIDPFNNISDPSGTIVVTADSTQIELTSVTASVTVGDSISVLANETGTAYLVPANTTSNVQTIIDESLVSIEGLNDTVAKKIPTAGITPATYWVYAIESSLKISAEKVVVINPPADQTPPVLSNVTTGSVFIGDTIFATSNEDGKLYIVPVGTEETLLKIQEAKVAQKAATAGQVDTLFNANITAGKYIVYAADEVGNLSLPSDTIIFNVPPDEIAPVLTGVTEGPIVIGDNVVATSNEPGMLYLVADSVAKVLVDITSYKIAEATAVAATEASLSSSNATAGKYIVYAVDTANNISDASAAIIVNNPPDLVAPLLTVTSQDSIDQGTPIVIESNEDGIVYLVPDGTSKVIDSIMVHKAAEISVIADIEASLVTKTINAGVYIIFATDTAKNISNASSAITILPDTVAPTFTAVATDTITVGETIAITVNENATLYLVADSIANVAADIVAAKAADASATANTEVNLSTSGVAAGSYIIYAIDAADNVSLASDTIIINPSLDVTAPVLSEVTTGVVKEESLIFATSNEVGTLYLVPAGSYTAVTALKDSAVSTKDVKANVADTLIATTSGIFQVFATDVVGNISTGSNTITVSALDRTAPVLSKVTTGSLYVGDTILATSNEDAILYLVADSISTTFADIVEFAQVTTTAIANVEAALTTADLNGGDYKVFAIDAANNISDPSAVITLIVPDVTAPILSNVTTDTITVGTDVLATSNEDGNIYLVPDSIGQVLADITSLNVASTATLADSVATLSTTYVAVGKYIVYAVDTSNNISEASAAITLIEAVVPVDTVAPILSNVTSGELTIGDDISATSNEDATLYLVADTITNITDIIANNVANIATLADSVATLSTVDLSKGTYVVYAVDTADNVSDASAVITLVEPAVVDTVAPVLSNVTEGTIAPGDAITATSNEDATLFLVAEGTAKELAAINDAQVATAEATAETATTLSTTDIADGNYVVYAIDGAENISDASAVITILTVSVNENMFNALTVYPNPASDYIHLNSNDLKEATILNITGETVKQINLANSKVEISDLRDGIYIIKAETNNGTYYLGRFIKN